MLFRSLIMIHYLSRFTEAAQNNWHKPAVCDYRGETFLYADVATHIAKMHILFDHAGVKPGDKIAIAGMRHYYTSCLVIKD